MERRLAAILAADVVGYSRLMATDEAGTFAALKALRKDFIEPKIVEHHGRIVKLMGDGALVEFPSVVEAVQCAVEVQRGVAERNAAVPDDRRMAFRIGVNLGDIIIEDDDIYGDGVNVAARLEALAEPGGVCVSGPVRVQVEDKLPFGFDDLGEQQVKNIPRPVHVFRVIPDGPAAPAATGRGRAKSTRLVWAAAAAVVLLAGAGGAWLWQSNEHAVPPASQQAARPGTTSETHGGAEHAPLDKHRIAVLPFVNMSGDVENEYFSDGITEELITQLSKIGELSVIARTSTMKYKGADKGIAEIGRELNAGTILEGSVRKAGDQVRIAAQLIDVASETHLWAEDYDRGLEEIFAIQSAIAEQVASNLKIALLGVERRRVEKIETENIEAYNLYLKAIYLWNQQTSDSVLKAVEQLEKAVHLDPTYAAAYAALADLSNELIYYTDIPPGEAHRKAMEYAERALALDDSLARGHLALAEARMYGEGDWEGAEQAYRRALDLNPSFARAHHVYALMFLVALRGRDDEGLAEVKRALELDPLSGEVRNIVGWVHYHRREYDQAITWFRANRELVPDDPWSLIGEGQSLVFLGKHEEGIDQLRRALEISPGVDFLSGFLGWAYGRAGKPDEAREVVERLKQKATTKTISPMTFAWAYTGMGDKDDRHRLAREGL